MDSLVRERCFPDHSCDRVAERVVRSPGKFSSNTLNMLRSSPDVESIAEDGIMSINAITTQFVAELPSFWFSAHRTPFPAA